MRHTPGKRWRHVILNAHGTWLPGDPRGFRDHDHRVHSTGDYKRPPPKGEHAGLLQYNLSQSAPPGRLPDICLPAIGKAIRDNLNDRNHKLAVLAVNPLHAHLLAELPDDVSVLKKAVGWCKFFATRAARRVEPTLENVTIWASGETYKPVDGDGHFEATLDYIATRQGGDAWVWRSSDL